jgi:hypothetical protein
MNPLCGAHSRSTGNPCQNIAGKGTNHLGQGRCRHHGGATPIQHGLYSKIRRDRLGKRIAEIAERSDLLQLDEELAMMKALLEDWIQQYQSRADGLRAWHRATSPAFQILIESNDASQIRDALVSLRAAEASRPTEIPDVAMIAMLVDKIGRTIERIHKTTTVCTRDQLQLILNRMGAVVAEYVEEETTQKIRDGWANITLEERR